MILYTRIVDNYFDHDIDKDMRYMIHFFVSIK